MAEDWFADVQKYAPNADPDHVAGIVRYCGIALRKRDSSLVSFSSPKETARVRDNFLKKKLALSLPDSTLDEAIASVGERMKADHTKNRVTVYYLLADHFGRLDDFIKTPKSVVPKAAGSAPASGERAANDELAAPREAESGSEPTASPGPLFEPGAEDASSAPPTRVHPAAFGTRPQSGTSADGDQPSASDPARFADVPPQSASRWWVWLLILIVVIVVLWLLFR